MEIAEDFQGIDPGFNASGFIAEDSGARSYRGQKFPGAHGADEFEGGGATLLRRILLGGGCAGGDKEKRGEDGQEFHDGACGDFTIEMATSMNRVVIAGRSGACRRLQSAIRLSIKESGRF